MIKKTNVRMTLSVDRETAKALKIKAINADIPLSELLVKAASACEIQSDHSVRTVPIVKEGK